MNHRLSKLIAALAVFALATVLTACGEKSEDGGTGPDKLTLTLDFYPNPDHAGIYVAQEKGYFEDAGLKVDIRTPSDPSAPLKEVASGQTDLAISYEPELLLGRDQGLDVEAVAALVDEPLTSLIWLGRSKIGGVPDLKGQTIATAGIPYQDSYLQTILARAGLTEKDVTKVNVGLGLLPSLISGKSDAILGGFSNIEGVDLQQRSLAPTITPVSDLGVPTYSELILVANSERLQDDPEPIRLFIAALEHGTRDAVADPAAALAAIKAANPGLDDRITQAELAGTLPLLDPGQGRFGEMDPAMWKEFIGWFRDNGLIKSLPTPSDVLTNDLLKSDIPD